MSLDWLGLIQTPGWKALQAAYREELGHLSKELAALALESTDPRVRSVAARIRAIEDFLARPEQEMETMTERRDGNGDSD